MNGKDLRWDSCDRDASELEIAGAVEVSKQGRSLPHPVPNAVFAGRIRTFGALTMIGGALLTAGAILIDLGWFADVLAIASLGNALAAISGLGLLFLPIGLRVSHLGGTGILATMGAASLVIGICLASIVDVPAILDPTDLEAGGAMGPIGLLLLSSGFLAWFFPTIQLPLFVVPNGKPSFILLAEVLGVLQLVMGTVLRERKAENTPQQKL
jgi:hypothetical protein